MNDPDCVQVLDLLLKNGTGNNNTQLFLRWYQKGGKYKNDIMQLLLKYCPIQILVLGFYETNSYNKNIAKKLFQSQISSKTYSKKLLNVTIQNIVYGDSTKSDFYVWILSMLLSYGFVTIDDPKNFIDKVNNIESKDLILNSIENLNINDLSSECKKYINIIPEKYRINITNIVLQILRAKSYCKLNFTKQEIHDLHQQIIYSPNSLRTRLAAIQWYISIGNIDKIITIPNLELLEELGIRKFILDDISKCIDEALKFA
nr:ankyrin repeat domain containing protein [Mimivirus sp.]